MIEADLAESIERIRDALAGRVSPDAARLQRVAEHLQAFVAKHRSAFDFEGFPLPDEKQGVLCAYTLFQAEGNGLTLRANAIAGGVNSAVHDHGTWAVIIGVLGVEVNRVYRAVERLHSDSGVCDLILDREESVGPEHALVLQAGEFHSIHTPPQHSALQLHLYGSDPDANSGRRAVELETGRWVGLKLG